MILGFISSSPFSKDFASEIPFEYIKHIEETVPDEEQHVSIV